MTAWISKLLVLFAAALAVGNAQCVTACAFPAPHCHHRSKQAPPCSHDLTVAESSAKVVTAQPAQMQFADFAVAPIAEGLQRAFSRLIDVAVSPPAPGLSSLSILRI